MTSVAVTATPAAAVAAVAATPTITATPAATSLSAIARIVSAFTSPSVLLGLVFPRSFLGSGFP